MKRGKSDSRQRRQHLQRSCGRRTWGEHEVRVENDGTVQDEATQADKSQVEKFVFIPRASGTTEGSQAVMRSDLPLRTIPLATRGSLCNVLFRSPCRNKGLLSRVLGGPLSECRLHVAPSWMVSAGEGTGPSHTPSQEWCLVWCLASPRTAPRGRLISGVLTGAVGAVGGPPGGWMRAQ